MDEFSTFATNIYKQKYAQTKPDGTLETWPETANRVARAVIAAAPSDETGLYSRVYELIRDRKFMPGGRYLYAAGRPFHQTQNCFSATTRVLTDRGVFDLQQLDGCKVRLRNRHGQWEDAEVRCFGEQEIYEVTLSNGDVIETTAGHLWWQADGTRLSTTDIEQVLLGKPEVVGIDPEGVRHGVIFGDGHTVKERYSQIVFVNAEKGRALSPWFVAKTEKIVVGFGAEISVDTVRETKRGTVVSLQPLHYKCLPCPESLTPEYARGFMAGLIATDGHVAKSGSVGVSCEGLSKARKIAEIAVQGGCVVTSVRVSSRVSPFSGEPRELCTVFVKPASAPILLPSHQANVADRKLTYRKMYLDVEDVRATGRYELVYCAVVPGSQSFTLANGVVTSNCLLLRAEDSREGWSDLLHKASMALMTGAGIGVDYSDIRPKDAPISRTGGKATGPLAVMQMVNECGRHIMQGGARRSAIWAGLRWSHKDVLDFIKIKDWQPEVRRLKEQDFNFPAPLDGTNVSVILDSEFFFAYQRGDEHAHKVYWAAVRSMLSNGEPGFSIDVNNPRESLRNACTEVVSEDDSDICNLGSVNLARIATLDEFKDAVRAATAFLLAGTLYSDVPYAKVAEVRTQNRRLGLGLMGVHEWLLQRGKRYGEDADLAEWLAAYREVSTSAAAEYSTAWGVSRPVATRALAPTGTIGIVGETTTGIEPVFCVAYRRRYKGDDGVTTKYTYVIDPTAKRLIDAGTPEAQIEDAYKLAEDVERRVAFQAWVQQYVDQAISSTINMPAWGSALNNEAGVHTFGEMLMRYLPRLRGITVYPDGARGGQPLVPVSYATAISKVGQVFIEQTDVCDISGKGGSCGS